MRVYRDLDNLPSFRNAVITIGSFDGLHIGHQKILRKVKDLAIANGGESIAITFNPHPRQIVFPKDDSLKLITTTEEKVELFKRYGIDHLVIVPFTIEFSQQSADEYIQRFLVQKFNPKFIVIGYDHRFGMNRRGDINYLRWHEKTCGYKVVEIAKKEINEIAVSSTKIRDALLTGDAGNAALLMNHFFTLTGKVIKGQQIGQKLGFPTANLQIAEKHKLIPKDGVYAAYANYDGERHKAMLYIGDRPTLKDLPGKTIEVNIFDFNKNIYEDEIQVELVEFIRHDKELKDLESLKAQIAKDQKAVEKSLGQADLTLARWNADAMPSVAVVILNYNGRKLLEKYLPYALKTSYPNCRVYVADNASKDESISYLKEQFPKVPLIELGQNHGFAKGYNEALKDLEEDYFVLLNSDVRVPPGWLDPLIKLLESNRNVAAVQPKVMSEREPEKFEHAGAAGGWIDFLGYPFCRGRIIDTVEVDKGQYDQETEIFWASGACMAVRAPLFKKFGGFDEEFFAHMEEIDLCWRMKRAGYKIMFTPRSTVYHYGGGTLSYQSPYKAYLNFRNSYYVILKNESALRMAYLMPIRIIMDSFAAVTFLLQRKWLHAQAVVGAFFSFFFALITFIKKRLDIDVLIQRVRISPQPNRQGILPKSIVFQYFIMGKKFFSNL
ncbi:MAG: bifunctional riboflavin kinase/FAD synthetase [Bacteroidota bacterium]